jgi:hypothetical protein
VSFDADGRSGETNRLPRWEYKDVPIYLNLSTLEFPDHQRLVQRFERIVERRLGQASTEGWEPVGPTGWGALQAAGRISRRQTAPFSARGIFQPAYVYEYATVRLRRPLAR